MDTRFNHFDFLAPLYDRFIKPKDPFKIQSLAGLPIIGDLLDVGGGTGRISYMLKDYVKGIVIADSSMGMLTQATKKGSFITVCSYSEQLPFKDESFERVIMVDALHHVNDYRITVDELWRVLRPEGRIVIEELNIKTLPVKLIALLEKITMMRSHFVSPNEIMDAFQHPHAKTRIECEGFTSWVVVDKLRG